MATIRLNDSDLDIHIPDIEVLAAFRMSRNTAQREGFPRTAAQVQGYIDMLEAEDIRIRRIRDIAYRLDATILGRI
jgi:hypothetical protein